MAFKGGGEQALNRLPDEEVSVYLQQIESGDRSAVERLLPLIYDNLKELARGVFRGQGGNHTLQPTALVHEAYVRLARPSGGYSGRKHFYDVAAMAIEIGVIA